MWPSGQGAINLRCQLRDAAYEQRALAQRAATMKEGHEAKSCWRKALAKLHRACAYRVAGITGPGQRGTQREREWSRWVSEAIETLGREAVGALIAEIDETNGEVISEGDDVPMDAEKVAAGMALVELPGASSETPGGVGLPAAASSTAGSETVQVDAEVNAEPRTDVEEREGTDDGTNSSLHARTRGR